jgi:hypothetical protein
MENAFRNVNTIRPFISSGTGYPFSKPRFILEDGRLELLNNPVIPPEEIPLIMNNMEEWNLAEYEAFYSAEEYRDYIWFTSKLIAYVEAASHEEQTEWSRFSNTESWDLSNEPAQLTLSIIENFSQDVEAHGGEFIIVRLPTYQDLSTFLNGEEPPYAELLARIEDDHHIIYPERERLTQVMAMNLPSLDALFTKKGGGHYSALTNEIIADVIAEFIVKQQFGSGDEVTLGAEARDPH